MTTALSALWTACANQLSCPAILTRSMPQPQASTAAAPMINSARSPRSKQTATTLGGPSAVSAVAGGRSRCSTARWVMLMASGRIIMTTMNQKPGMALATQNPHSSTIPADNIAFCAPRPSGAFWMRRFGTVVQRGRATPYGFQCNGEKAEAKRIGDKLAPFQREAKRAQQPDSDPAESKPADEHREPPAPEPRCYGVHRDDGEAFGLRGQQKMTDRYCDPGGEESDEIAEYHLAEQRRPIERQEGANAAERKGHNAESKGQARSDKAQAAVDSLHRQTVKALSHLVRRSAKTATPRRTLNRQKALRAARRCRDVGSQLVEARRRVRTGLAGREARWPARRCARGSPGDARRSNAR